MVSSSTVALFCALRLLSTVAPGLSSASPQGYVPNTASNTYVPPVELATTSAQAGTTNGTAVTPPDSTWWFRVVPHIGTVPYNGDPSYGLFRNVRDLGATGDGVTDDTEAINDAIAIGNRCGKGCESSTTKPALVYFPPGTYVVSAPIIQLYNTQLVGDATNIPIIKAAANFEGEAVIDSNPSEEGRSWYTPQNNFYRQIRNFVIDLTAMPASSGTGIHWQVAQATSLQNIRFEMVRGGSGNNQQGIYMENGSGGLMTDLVFNGGHYGASLGNQQFTTRNLTFNGCDTAISMTWNWLWTFKSLNISACRIGLNIAYEGQNTSVGSVTLQDSIIANTPVGVASAFSNSSTPVAAGTLIIDNVDFLKCEAAIADPATNRIILHGGTKVGSWVQGRVYGSGLNLSRNATNSTSGSRIQQGIPAPARPATLIDSSGKYFERSRPQYETLTADAFLSAKALGVLGNGQADDTAALQNAINVAFSQNKILYIDHGVYLVSDTIRVPKDMKITGEMWPIIMAYGDNYRDVNAPRVVFEIGVGGEVGAVELTDLLFTTGGPTPGAIMLKWNTAASAPGANGMWDVHIRIGGAAYTRMQSDVCGRSVLPGPVAAKEECIGSLLLVHLPRTASVYLENTWFWVADHDLDSADHGPINIYNGRGVAVESQGPSWLYAAASEHSQLYQWQFNTAKSLYASTIQSETPYHQPNPDATAPFPIRADFNDPDFANCTTPACKKAWGMRVIGSSEVLIYGAGLYSFFESGEQSCVATQTCQQNMVEVRDSSLSLYALNTVGVEDMLTTPGGAIDQEDNRNNFAATLALFQGGNGTPV